MRMATLMALCAVGMLGCSDSTDIDPTPPDKDPGDPTDPADGRRLSRLTADQFHRSLQVATGQTWSQFENFAATLGRADFVEINDEGRDLSITFDKLVHDAARETCKEAVNADVLAIPAPGVILARATVADRGTPELAANLQYMLLRFFGQKVTDAADARLLPWLELLTHDDGTGPITDETMAERWKAVCIGFVTHPDFVTY